MTQAGERTYFQSNGQYIPCRNKRCNVNPCPGTMYEFDGEWRFHCDACGKGMVLGRTATGASENQAFVQGWDTAETNRKRMWREYDAMQADQMQRQIHEYAAHPSQYSGVTANPDTAQQFLNI